MESEKNKLIAAVEWWLPGGGVVGEVGRFCSKGVTSSYKINKFGALMYSMVFIAINTLSCT